MRKNLENTFKFLKNLFTPTLSSVKPYSLTYFKRGFKFRKRTSKLQEWYSKGSKESWKIMEAKYKLASQFQKIKMILQRKHYNKWNII